MAAIKATDDQVREAYQKHRNVAEAARACGLSQRRYQIRLRQIGVPSAGFNHHTGTKAQFEAHGGQALDFVGGGTDFLSLADARSQAYFVEKASQPVHL